jgi:hypothetical protein
VTATDRHVSQKAESPVPAACALSVVVFCSRTEARPLDLLDDLLRWLDGERDAELVLAFDGDQGETARAVRDRIRARERVRIVVLSARQGQLATLRAGIAVAGGRNVVTFPAFPQVDVSAIAPVLERLAQGADYVVGYRENRRVSLFNRVVAGVFNGMVRYASGTAFRDIACGTHGFRREIMATVPNYGDNQLFLPILAAREGFQVAEAPVRQHATAPTLRLFSPMSYLTRALSLFTLAFLVRFTQKPLRPFGALGVTMFVLGSILALVLVWQRLFMDRGLAERPLLLLALLLITAGIQVIILGLLGELLIYLHFRDQAQYRVRETIGRDERSGA